MKKRWCVCLVCALLLLAGCGVAEMTAEPQTEAPAVTEAPTAEPTEEPTAEPTEEPTPEPAPTFVMLDTAATVISLSNETTAEEARVETTGTEQVVTVSLAFDPPAQIGSYFGEGGTEGKTMVEYFSDGVILRDAAGTEYEPQSVLMPVDHMTYSDNFPDTIGRISVVYLVPEEVSLSGMTLVFADGNTANLDTDVSAFADEEAQP